MQTIKPKILKYENLETDQQYWTGLVHKPNVIHWPCEKLWNNSMKKKIQK
jgi:hypothetical protein